MKNAIAKALKDLDGLGERAVRTRILGITDEADKAAPADGQDGQKPGDTDSEPEGGEFPEGEMDPETKKKLLDLLKE